MLFLGVDYSYIFLFFMGFFVVAVFLLFLSFSHFIVVLLFLDLLLLVNIILFVFFTQLTGDSVGYAMALLLLGVAAADTAVGLGLFMVYYKTTQLTSLS